MSYEIFKFEKCESLDGDELPMVILIQTKRGYWTRVGYTGRRPGAGGRWRTKIGSVALNAASAKVNDEIIAALFASLLVKSIGPLDLIFPSEEKRTIN